MERLVTLSCHTETFSSYNDDNGDKMVENPNSVHSIAILWTVLGFSTEMSETCHRKPFLSDTSWNIHKMVENLNTVHSIAMLWTVLGFSTKMSYLVWNHAMSHRNIFVQQFVE